MEITVTQPADYDETVNLTREAFWNVYRPGCDEHLVLRNFRGQPDFLPELDCVIRENGQIVAHIMYCRAELRALDGSARYPALMFGPISVLPERQRQGYGSAIIKYTLEKARGLGHNLVVITGNPAYYHRFGFESCSKYGIFYEGLPHDDEAAFFMLKALRPGVLPDRECVFAEPEGYRVDPEELEAFEKRFPPKVKEKRPGQLV